MMARREPLRNPVAGQSPRPTMGWKYPLAVGRFLPCLSRSADGIQCRTARAEPASMFIYVDASHNLSPARVSPPMHFRQCCAVAFRFAVDELLGAEGIESDCEARELPQ